VQFHGTHCIVEDAGHSLEHVKEADELERDVGENWRHPWLWGGTPILSRSYRSGLDVGDVQNNQNEVSWQSD
jgi:hypothetical protein